MFSAKEKMFVVYVLATLAALCTALPQETELLEKYSNYALPQYYGELPSYEKVLELYQRQLRKEQEEQLRKQWHQIHGFQEHAPHQYSINLHEPFYHHHQDEQHRHHNVHGHKILVSDHDILIEFSRLKLLAKEAEHYFRPEFNGHKLRHHDLIAYIEQLLKFGAERDQYRKQNDDPHYMHLQRQNEYYTIKDHHEREKHRPLHVVVSDEHIKRGPQYVSDIEHLRRPHEEHRPPYTLNEERSISVRENERRPPHIHLEKRPIKIDEEVKVPIKPNVAFFVPYNIQHAHQYAGLPEQGPREVCINCGRHYNQ